jgi:hypothetical protein
MSLEKNPPSALFHRAQTYYSLSIVIYEALAIAAFLWLLLAYIGSSTDEQKAA